MDDNTAATIKAYDCFVEQYTANTADMFHSIEFETFSRQAGYGSLILDIGCVSGRDAKIFYDCGFSVVGIDLSEGMLKAARQYVQQTSGRNIARFSRMDMRELGFADNSFDGIWCVSSLLHLAKTDAQTALDEMYRVLKSCGALYLAVKQGEGEGLEDDLRYGEGVQKYYSYFQQKEIEKMLLTAGFINLETKIELWHNEYQKKPEIRIHCMKF